LDLALEQSFLVKNKVSGSYTIMNQECCLIRCAWFENLICRCWEEYFYPKLAGSKCHAWCKFTFNHEDAGKADLILFSELIEDQVPPPPVRHPWQLWGFYTQEPPFIFPRDKKELDRWKFNWTLTYRLDSDIPIPYGEFKTRREQGKKDVPLAHHEWVTRHYQHTFFFFVHLWCRRFCSGQSMCPGNSLATTRIMRSANLQQEQY
jgi:hypothetical protein